MTRSGPRTYLQIVHAYRDEETGRPKQKHIANLGRADQFGESDLDSLINGLLKFTNRVPLDELHSQITSEGTTFRPALQVGDIWAILGIWHQLSPEEMLYRLRAVQRHSVRLANGKELEGLSAITPEQRTIFDAAGVPLPTMKRLNDAA